MSSDSTIKRIAPQPFEDPTVQLRLWWRGPNPRIGVNTKEISDHITALAERELNGRQIRNIISTARKLATYRNQPVCYEHLQKVIDEADKSEKYIVDLHRGIPDDDLEYSNGVR